MVRVSVRYKVEDRGKSQVKFILPYVKKYTGRKYGAFEGLWVLMIMEVEVDD